MACQRCHVFARGSHGRIMPGQRQAQRTDWTYAHVIPSGGRLAADAVADALGGA